MSPYNGQSLYELGRKQGFWRGFRWGWLWSGIASTVGVVVWHYL